MKSRWIGRAVFTAVCLFVALACAAAYIAFNLAQMFYASEIAVRLDPLGIAAYSEVPTPIMSDHKRLVFVGDSRAESWPPPAGLPDWEFVNRGIAGQTTAQIAGRFAAHVAPLNPQVIVLQLGVNDLRAIPITPHLRASIIANCLTNIKAVIHQARDLGAAVILTTIFPVAEPSLDRRLFFWSEDIARAVSEVNDALRPLAADHVLILDADPILLDAAGLPRQDYLQDSLHLNPTGYEALNRQLSQLLESLP